VPWSSGVAAIELTIADVDDGDDDVELASKNDALL